MEVSLQMHFVVRDQALRRELLTGLTDEQVIASRERYGSNILKQAKQKGLLRQFFENLSDPIIRVLLVALGINLIFSLNGSRWYESIGIALAILLSTLVATLSMHQSETAFKKLQEEASQITCRVVRAGMTQLKSIGEIVVGDLVLLQPGERIPADGIILSGELDVDQSSLNGETKEAHKAPLKTGGETGLSNPSSLFSGSVVCAGDGVMRVEEVGEKTFLGRLAGEIQEETRESPLKLRLAHLAGTISKFGTAGALLVAVADLFHIFVLSSGFNLSIMQNMLKAPGFLITSLLHAVTLAVTVIVVAVPEGLPMMITVVLSANMKRMLRDNVLVRRLVGIETAGSIDVLFTDKTGTLTEGHLSVACIVRGDGHLYEDPGKAAGDAEYWEMLHTSLQINNAADMAEGKPVGGNTTDRALLKFLGDLPDPGVRVTRGKVIPFSSETKFMATDVSGDYNFTLIKGAPEQIVARCTKYIGANGREQQLLGHAAINRIISGMAGKGMRILAAAISSTPVDKSGEFQQLTLVGLIGIKDPLRPEAAGSVSALQEAGVQVIMITGDSKETAEAIARDAKLIAREHDLIMTSAQLNAMSDEELIKALPDLRVIARALPGDKSRLVGLAQRRGSVVGMTGDGVNDSAALKKADVGFAMGSGTEVAKEASDIVILDDNLSSVVKAVLYGRTIFRSIRKFIVFQLTVNLCAVGVSIIAPFIGFEEPLSVLQMLWVNMVMDTLAGLAFSGEPALQRYLRQKPKRREEPIINREIAVQIAVMGTFTMLLCLWFLVNRWIQTMFQPANGKPILLTAFFAVFIYAGIFNSFSARTDRMNLADHILGNKAFIVVMTFVFLVQTCLLFWGGSLFRAYGLTIHQWLFCILLSTLVIPVDLLRKAIRRCMNSGI
jgi:calcium-translocating P-type ATPase